MPRSNRVTPWGEIVAVPARRETVIRAHVASDDEGARCVSR